MRTEWWRWLFFDECKSCSRLLTEQARLERELQHYKDLAITLAEKISHRATPPIVEAEADPKPERKQKRGVTWERTRGQLEQQSNQ